MTTAGRIRRRKAIRANAQQLAGSIRVWGNDDRVIRITSPVARKALENAFDYLLLSAEPDHVRRIGAKVLAGFPTHRTSAPDGPAYLAVCVIGENRGAYILFWDDVPGFSLADQHAANRALAEQTIARVRRFVQQGAR